MAKHSLLSRCPSYIQHLGSYLTDDTVNFPYKDQPLTAGYVKSWNFDPC